MTAYRVPGTKYSKQPPKYVVPDPIHPQAAYKSLSRVTLVISPIFIGSRTIEEVFWNPKAHFR